MFKFGKGSYEQSSSPLADRPTNPFSTDLMNALEPRHSYEAEETSEEEEPETTIAPGVTIKGTITFQRLLRIDGTFEGELISNGKLIVGPTGSVKANINMEEAYISGKVTGDITVKNRLVLRGRAEVRGDVTASLISVDEGVSIVGIMNIAQQPEAAPDNDLYSDDN